jgi:hypothetical protein
VRLFIKRGPFAGRELNWPDDEVEHLTGVTVNVLNGKLNGAKHEMKDLKAKGFYKRVGKELRWVPDQI